MERCEHGAAQVGRGGDRSAGSMGCTWPKWTRVPSHQGARARCGAEERADAHPHGALRDLHPARRGAPHRERVLRARRAVARQEGAEAAQAADGRRRLGGSRRSRAQADDGGDHQEVGTRGPQVREGARPAREMDDRARRLVKSRAEGAQARSAPVCCAHAADARSTEAHSLTHARPHRMSSFSPPSAHAARARRQPCARARQP